MTDKLTILCPITSRNCGPDRSQQPIFHALLPSMDALKMWGKVRAVCGYDDDDSVWALPKVRSEVAYPIEWKELTVKGSLTSTWNDLERMARPWEWLLPANDDMAFQTSPLPAIETLKARKGFGTVAFADEAFPNLPTFYVVGKLHVEIFGCLYPLPWTGAHQDPWIADVYRPWRASEIDPAIQVHNRIGPPSAPVGGPRFEYGPTPLNYREIVLDGRRRVNEYLKTHSDIAEPLTDGELCQAPMLL